MPTRTHRHYWKDVRLAWNPDDWGGVQSIVMFPNQIWLPDTDVYDLHSQVLLGNQAATIYPSGDAYWSSQVPARPNLAKMPRL